MREEASPEEVKGRPAREEAGGGSPAEEARAAREEGRGAPGGLRGFDEPREARRFLDTFLYEPDAFLVDEIRRVDPGRRVIEARLDTTRELPLARHQRVRPGYPAHVSAGELVMITACLGSLHGWLFHGCRWAEGWVGFGNRIHRADFKSLARVGPPLDLRSRETASRRRPRRLVVRYEFDFRQDGTPVYYGDQTAIFLKDAAERLSG